MANNLKRVAESLHKGLPGERLVTLRIGYQSMQDYPSNLKGIWRAAYNQRRMGKAA